jgi:hypothetical protein
MSDNPNAHKPCKVRDHLLMAQDSTYGKEPYYQLTCGTVGSMTLALHHG